MRKQFTWVLCALFVAVSSFAQKMDVEWGVQFGSAGTDFAEDVVSDNLGNSIVVGKTNGSMVGDGLGRDDGFVIKYDKNGTKLWEHQMGTTVTDDATGVAVDSKNNIYVYGNTSKQIGEATFGKYDVYIIKYDAKGEQIWAKQFGTSKIDKTSRIHIDNQDNLYIVGQTQGDWSGTNLGSYDLFAGKLDGDGNLLWICQFGSDKSETGKSIIASNSGDVFVAGYTTGAVGGEPLGDQDGFFAKINSAGELQWAKKLGTSTRDNATGIAFDNTGNIYVGGWTGGVMGSRQYGGGDAFLSFYDAEGNHLWTKQFGTSNWDGAHGMATINDGSGDALIGGCWSWPTCHGWVRRYNNKGELVWDKEVYNNRSKSSCGQTVAIDANGNCYHIGGTDDDLFTTNAGEQDGFLVKISDGTSDVEKRDDKLSQPESMLLEQNYPNPFNASTRIDYKVENSSRVFLGITNLNGRVIRTLVDDYIPQGQYSAVWNAKNDFGKDVASGMYVGQLVTNNSIERIKLVLMR